MCGIKIPQQDFALKMQGGFMRNGGGGYLRGTTVHAYVHKYRISLIRHCGCYFFHCLFCVATIQGWCLFLWKAYGDQYYSRVVFISLEGPRRPILFKGGVYFSGKPPPPQKKTHPAVKIVRLFSFKPLSCQLFKVSIVNTDRQHQRQLLCGSTLLSRPSTLKRIFIDQNLKVYTFVPSQVQSLVIFIEWPSSSYCSIHKLVHG